MEQKQPKVTPDLPPGLHKQFRIKAIKEGRTVKGVVRQLIESWVKGVIVLPEEPVKPTRPAKSKRK